jgi:hypothetical protein
MLPQTKSAATRWQNPARLSRKLEGPTPEPVRNIPSTGYDASPGYASPQEVLRDAGLSLAAKRDVLHRWAVDLVRERMMKPDDEARTSLLDAVIDALLDLNEPDIARLMPDRLRREGQSGLRREHRR